MHHDQKIADIYLRISGKGRGYFIAEDNELSFRNLKHQYTEGKINNNRIICNKIVFWDNILSGEFIGKLIGFYKFTSAKSLGIGKIYFSNHYGQIKELTYSKMRTRRGTALDNQLRKMTAEKEAEYSDTASAKSSASKASK